MISQTDAAALVAAGLSSVMFSLWAWSRCSAGNLPPLFRAAEVP